MFPLLYSILLIIVDFEKRFSEWFRLNSLHELLSWNRISFDGFEYHNINLRPNTSLQQGYSVALQSKGATPVIMFKEPNSQKWDFQQGGYGLKKSNLILEQTGHWTVDQELVKLLWAIEGASSKFAISHAVNTVIASNEVLHRFAFNLTSILMNWIQMICWRKLSILKDI